MKVCSIKPGNFLSRSTWGLLLIIVGGVSHAHHSFAMFDISKETEVEGVVEEFRFINPHTYFTLEIPRAGGEPEAYLLEAPTPAILMRLGWTRSTLKPGDKIKVLMHPLRDGRPGGNALRVTFADGKVMSLVNEDIKYGK